MRLLFWISTNHSCHYKKDLGITFHRLCILYILFLLFFPFSCFVWWINRRTVSNGNASKHRQELQTLKVRSWTTTNWEGLQSLEHFVCSWSLSRVDTQIKTNSKRVSAGFGHPLLVFKRKKPPSRHSCTAGVWRSSEVGFNNQAVKLNTHKVVKTEALRIKTEDWWSCHIQRSVFWNVPLRRIYLFFTLFIKLFHTVSKIIVALKIHIMTGSSIQDTNCFFLMNPCFNLWPPLPALFCFLGRHHSWAWR